MGLGHTNAEILRRIAETPLSKVDVVCVSDHPEATYSGMLPASLAGQVSPEEMRIQLRQLAEAAGAALIVDAVRDVDAMGRIVRTRSGREIPFDVLSIGVGSRPSGLPPSANQPSGTTQPTVLHASVIPVKPMQTFHDRLNGGLQSVQATPHTPNDRDIQIAIVGGGIAAVELACCLNQRLTDQQIRHRMTVYTASPRLANELSKNAAAIIERTLDERGIRVQTECRVVIDQQGCPKMPREESPASSSSTTGTPSDQQPQGGSLGDSKGEEVSNHENGSRLDPAEPDLFVWATNAVAPDWFAHTDLSKDERGFLRVKETLQSVDHPNIFVAGDSASFIHQHVPKAGVYAVRQSPVLWHNLRTYLTRRSRQKPNAVETADDPSSQASDATFHEQSEPKSLEDHGLRNFVAQKSFLKLINLGDGTAVLVYRGFAFRSRLAMWLKHWIDQRFVRQFQSTRRG